MLATAYPRDVTPGQTVRFRYNSGSRPGATRTLQVESNNGNTLFGTDKDVNEYRQFSYRYISGAVTVLDAPAPATVTRTVPVYFTTARTQIAREVMTATGEKLAAAYSALFGKPATFNTATANVEVQEPEKTFVVDGKVLTATQLRQLVATL